MFKWIIDIFTSTSRVKIVFSANGEGRFQYDGNSVPCLGKPGERYPKDQIVENIEAVQYEGQWQQAFKFRRWVSKEFPPPDGGAVMLWSVKINGAKGIFVHQGNDTLVSNGGASEGCVHLAVPNAEHFYKWISGRTRIEIEYPW